VEIKPLHCGGDDSEHDKFWRSISNDPVTQWKMEGLAAQPCAEEQLLCAPEQPSTRRHGQQNNLDIPG
jgi:hypothetical protein